MNYEFGCESGFINSQPSLAECLTHLPRVADSFQSSSIKRATLSHPTQVPPPFEQRIRSLHPRHGRPRQDPNGCSPLSSAEVPPEYPWMKGKKAANKSHLPTSTATAAASGAACFSPKGEMRTPAGERWDRGENKKLKCCFLMLFVFGSCPTKLEGIGQIIHIYFVMRRA